MNAQQEICNQLKIITDGISNGIGIPIQWNIQSQQDECEEGEDQWICSVTMCDVTETQYMIIENVIDTLGYEGEVLFERDGYHISRFSDVSFTLNIYGPSTFNDWDEFMNLIKTTIPHQ